MRFNPIFLAVVFSLALGACDGETTSPAPDSDKDGVINRLDDCPDTPAGTAVDDSGCPLPPDGDGDGVEDSADLCPGTAEGATVDANGCSTAQLDGDNDGVSDAADQCPTTPANEVDTVDANGCADSERDSDADGVNDLDDNCPGSPMGEAVDAQGCTATQASQDDDADGVLNGSDECPGTPEGETVDAQGCSTSQLDPDGDGVNFPADQCPGTPEGETVDADGCSASQLDDDGDGVSNGDDVCPATEAGAAVDANGCSAAQLDPDEDGVNVPTDACADTAAGAEVDPRGCAAVQRTSIWMNVVPPGANGNSAGGGAQGQNHPDYFTDQLFLYEELAFSPEGLKAADDEGNCTPPNNTGEHIAADRSIACSHFKPAYLEPTEVTSTLTVTNPNTGNTVTIRRDGWGVPFVTGPTREDGMFGVGFVGAQDRLFLHDVLRAVGRGKLSEFLGPADGFHDFEEGVLADAGYSEDEMTAIVDATIAKFDDADPETMLVGQLVRSDLDNLVDGINEYLHRIGVSRLGAERHTTPTPTDGSLSNERPPEYGTLVPQTLPALWNANDVVASAILIQSTFAFGGGGEHQNLNTLLALDSGLSEANKALDVDACKLWRDLRHATDPDTPQTDPDNAVGAAQSPAVIPEDCTAAWPNGHGTLPEGTAVWDAGSYQERSVVRREDAGLPGPLASNRPVLDQAFAWVAAQPWVSQASAWIKSAVRNVASVLGVAPTPTAADKAMESLKVVQGAMEEAAGPRRAASNFIGVPASETVDGYPIAVAGPQAGYFLSQLLWEVAVQTDDGPAGLNRPELAFAGRGVVFGNLPYINIGRGIDFSFSATSGNSDLVDLRVSKMCNLDGSPPSRDDADDDGFPDSDGYLFDDDLSDGFDPVCRPFYFRTDQWEATPTAASLASNGPPNAQDVSHFVMRTHYGIVKGTALVNGEPVAISKQRSTFFADLDTAPPFALLTTHVVNGPESFFDLFNGTTGTFNWLYSDRDHLGWFHSGLYPKRHPQQHPELPVWGDGRYEWEGINVDLAADPDFFNRVENDGEAYPTLVQVTWEGTDNLDGKVEFPGFLSRDEHPHVIDPPSGFLHSWNNNPAANWWAADGNGSYGPIHRANMLRDRMTAFKDSGRKHTIATMVEIMGDAAHTDLRGLKVIPKALEILRTTTEEELTMLALSQLPDLATLNEAIDFLNAWAEDGSQDWIVEGGEASGLGGYRRGPRGDTSGSARSDGDSDVGFVYDYRPQIVLSDVWYPKMLKHTLAQVVERPAGVSAFQGIHDDMLEGSAFQAGWYQFLDRTLGQALDAHLGLDGTADEYSQGTYNVLACGGAGATFAQCRQALLTSLDEAIQCLQQQAGFADRDQWDGTTTASYLSGNLGSCLEGQATLEVQDQTGHVAISAQTVEPMHWTNRPTYQHAVQIKHDRTEDGRQ